MVDLITKNQPLSQSAPLLAEKVRVVDHSETTLYLARVDVYAVDYGTRKLP
mgnify:CR=1 FL=1